MSPRGSVSSRAAWLATTRPWLVVALWGAAMLVMAIAGLGAKSVLKPEDMIISGTPSAKTIALERRTFGSNSTLMVMLEGPPAALDRAGPVTARAVDAIPGVTVSSPWSPGAPAFLRQSDDRALLIATIKRELFDAGHHVAPTVMARVHTTLPPSVRSYVAGQPRFNTQLIDLVLSGAQKAELVALPFLLLILLLIFRAPIAALLPLAQGLAVIVLTTGFVTLVGRLTPVNVLSQASGSIIGLALGVDYSLLFVSRFRDELSAGAGVSGAIGVAVETAGRTVAFAGGILAAAGCVVIGVSLGWGSMTTGSIGVIAAAVFSVLAAFTLLPAMLAIAGERVNSWPIGRISTASALAPFVARVTRRPLAASAVALVPLLALCAAAINLPTGAPDLKVFRGDNPVRDDISAVANAYGGGVMSPYEVLVKAPTGPVVAPSNVRAIEAFQRELALDPAVRFVVGPGTARVRRASDAASGSKTQLAKLDYGLGAASLGVRRVREGLARGSGGATQLASGNASAVAGARRLRAGFAAAANGASLLSSGVGRSAAGSRELDSALAQLSSAASKLSSATATASSTAHTLAGGASFLQGRLAEANAELARIGTPSNDAANSLASAKAALDAMPASAKSDANFSAAYQAVGDAQNALASGDYAALGGVRHKYDSLAALVADGAHQASAAETGAARLASGSARVARGLRAAAHGTTTLSSGLGRLADGSRRLEGGFNPLLGGSDALASGLNSLSGGSGALGAGLSSGYRNSRGLQTGLGKLRSAVRGAVGGDVGDGGVKRLARSPYLTMALLSAASPAEKENLRLVLNEPEGGTTARIFLFTRGYPSDKSLRPFARRLDAAAHRLSTATGAQVLAGGPGRTFVDYDAFTHSRIWRLVALMGLMSFLFLLVVFRSPLLAAKAVVLNTITVGAAMGALELLYAGANPPLGGSGWLEATAFFVVYSTTFALSMDYEIFMINRMRETFMRTGSNELAIHDGVAKTASIVTGSAAVMCVLFLAMAFTSDLVNSAQMGLGLAFAIAIDATIVRLVLLPASMRLFGELNWWLPSWLDRLLPDVAVH